MDRKKEIFKIQLYVFISIISTLLIVYAINVFPIPGTDSRVFIPAALEYSKGYGLINPLYDLTALKGLYANTSQHFQFNYYVPLFPLLVGSLGKVYHGMKTIFFICSLLSITSLLLYARTICSLLPAKTTASIKILLLLSVTYLATGLLPTVGRPENLSSLLALLFYLLYRNRSTLHTLLYNILVCVLFACMLSTQVMCFYFSFLFFITYEVLQDENVYKTILINTARVIFTVVLFFIILSLSPNGLLNTLNGIKVHGTWALTRADRSLRMFIYYWLYAPLSFGFLAVFLLSSFFYVKLLFVRFKSVTKPQVILVSLLQLAIVYGIGKFVIYASPAVYNATQFVFPLVIFLFINIFSFDSTRLKRFYTTILFITYFAGSLVFLRWFILFIDYKTDGKDYDSAKSVINQIAKNSDNVYVTADLWPLFDNPADVKLVNGHYKTGDTIIVQQIYIYHPEEYLKGCTVLYDWRTHKKNLFGIPLSNTPQCYSFVICRVN